MGEPSNADYFRVLAESAAQVAPSAADVARIEADVRRQKREERLSGSPAFAGPAITPEDRRAIIQGTLSVQTQALRAVRAWQERYRGLRPGVHIPIMVLVGLMGRGKTVAGAWLNGEEGGIYVSALQLCKRLVSGHWRDSDWSNEVLSARVVVLDDVGTEFDQGKDQAIAAMYEFVNRRQSLERGLTLITTNLTRPEFVERYGARTMHKLMHSGRFAEIGGPDLRGKC